LSEIHKNLKIIDFFAVIAGLTRNPLAIEGGCGFGSADLTIRRNDETVEIDSFLLSCRILGKGIENAFLQYVLMKLKDEGVKTVSAKYIKTLKNSQVADFYEKNGFTL
jgi:predicted enzyme involved in methoxymalonyl-ACP biosynthesis